MSALLGQVHELICSVLTGLAMCWPTVGADIDPGSFSFNDPTGRKEVNCKLATRGAVVLVFGQSNSANESDAAGIYIPKGPVYNFNFLDGRCYVARDPLLGGGLNRSSFATRLGDLLVLRGTYPSVLLVAGGYGGSRVAQWAPGGSMHPRITGIVDLMNLAGISATIAVWQQGEAEGQDPNADPTEYQRSFRLMLASLRQHGMKAPIYVARSTVCKGPPNQSIRQAQFNLEDPDLGIFRGADTDIVKERVDGCHFSAVGLQKAAELWYSVLANAAQKSKSARAAH